MCKIPNSRLLPKTANDGQIVAWSASQKRWVAQDNSGGGSFDPTQDQDISGNYSFSKPVQMAIYTDEIVLPTYSYSIYTATELIESRFFKASNFKHHYDYSALTSDRTILIPDAGGMMVTTEMLPGHLKLSAPLDATLRSVYDYANTQSPIQLSTTTVGIGRTGADGLLRFNRTLDGAAVGNLGLRAGFSDMYWETNNINFRTNSTGFFFGGGSSWVTPTARIIARGDGINDIFRLEDVSNTAKFRLSANGNSLYIPANIYPVASGVQNIYFNINTAMDTWNFVTGQSATNGFYITPYTGISMNVTGSVFKLGNITYVYTSATSTIVRSALNIDYTINNTGAASGITVNGILLNATETSLIGTTHNLMDLQRAGISQFSVSRVGSVVTAGSIVSGANLGATNTGEIYWGSRVSMKAQTGGVMTIYDGSLTDFNRMQLGGTTVLYPSIKRNGAGIDFRFADDNGYANIMAGAITADQDIIFNSNLGYGFKSANGSRFLSVTNALIYSNVSMPFLWGGSSINASSIFQIDSTTKGFLTPRMTTVQQDGISSPATGLLLFDTSRSMLSVYSSSWQNFITNKSNMAVGADYEFSFTNTNANPFATKDLGFKRGSAGLLEITDGSTGCGGIKSCFILTRDLAGGGLASATQLRFGSTGMVGDGALTALGIDTQLAIQVGSTILYVPCSTNQFS